MRTTLATGTIPARVVTRRSEVDRAFRLSEEAWGRAVRGLAFEPDAIKAWAQQKES